ncbi:MAG TPA: PD-(D/E)XK nuclease family protein [Methanomicrobiales archaeon]|nr:PD-(D/E)XK nuclease family protein [Methanomicrobiales archaeon]
MQKTLVSVSEIVRCHFCPVRFSIERKQEIHESPRYTIAKQVSVHLAGDLDPDAIWEEVEAILPEIDPSFRPYLDTAVERCRAGAWRIPSETEVPVRSDRFGIRGLVDKIYDDEPTFAITRPTEAPALGVPTADRLRVAAYALCIRESLGTSPVQGAVEYIPSGEARVCTPQPRDRRAVIRAAEEVRHIREGHIPKRPAQAPCNGCPYQERCHSGGRRLSDLFGRRP